VKKKVEKYEVIRIWPKKNQYPEMVSAEAAKAGRHGQAFPSQSRSRSTNSSEKEKLAPNMSKLGRSR